MSTLKVNKLRDTAGSADAITLDPNGGAVLAGVTTMTTARVTSGIVTNTFIVGAGVTISESGIEASGIGITCASINGAQIGGRRNISINGACEVAQRGTSSTTYGYGSVDRFAVYTYGHNEIATHSQVDVASGTSPYSEGFRKALKVTNGNQTSGAAAAQFMQIQHKYEAQDIAKSGWNYTSTSSFITVQFWVKASVAQTYYAYLRSYDGTGQRYYWSFALSADTWTKVIKTIPGNSNLQFDNDVNQGFHINWGIWYGTDYTASGLSAETWAAYASGTRVPDMTSTWWTTNDATFEVTGVQMEVGSQATAFEHRSFGEELQLCKRYYEQFEPQLYVLARYNHSNGNPNQFYFFNVEKRAAPSGSYSGTFTSNSGYTGNPTFSQAKTNGIVIGSTNSCDASGVLYLDNSGSATCKFEAEI